MSEAEAGPDALAARSTGWGRRLTLVALLTVGGTTLVATLMSFLAPAIWWLDLLTHFQPQFAIVLLMIGLTQLLVRPRLLASLWFVGALLSALPLAPLYLGRGSPATGESLTIVHCNTGGDAVDDITLVQWLNRVSPDLILLQEVTPRNLPRIEAGLLDAGHTYELLAVEARNDTRGVAVFSRRSDVTAATLRLLPEHDRPMVQSSLTLSGTPVSILGFHNTRPAPARLYQFQSEGIRGAIDWCREQSRDGSQYALIGDFNSTSRSALVTDLRREAGLIDARVGHGILGTWPAHLPAPLRTPIDGAYHSAGLVATDMIVGPNIGSDHLPILVTLRCRANTD